jgi:hypothetical protein
VKCNSPTTGINNERKEQRICVRCGKEQWTLIGKRFHPGSCNGTPSLYEFGEWLALILEAVFITPQSYGWLLWKLRLRKRNEPCRKCGERKEAANEIGKKLLASLAPPPTEAQNDGL